MHWFFVRVSMNKLCSCFTVLRRITISCKSKQCNSFDSLTCIHAHTVDDAQTKQIPSDEGKNVHMNRQNGKRCYCCCCILKFASVLFRFVHMCVCVCVYTCSTFNQKKEKKMLNVLHLVSSRSFALCVFVPNAMRIVYVVCYKLSNYYYYV